MTEVQQAAIARAQAQINPAMQLYELRNYMTYRVGLLALPDLQRLVTSMRQLGAEDFLGVIDYIEGLALFAAPNGESDKRNP